MEFKQNTILDILESEHSMVVSAPERYGDYYNHAHQCTMYLSNFIKSIDASRWIFGAFLSQIKKHHTLSLFSVVRLHKVQAMMDLRQVLESGANAAYAIAEIDPANFVDTDSDGILDATQKLRNKRYTWLDNNYPDGSNAIKKIKSQINDVAAHSNLISTHNNFSPVHDEQKFSAPFFDKEDKYLIEADLWQIAQAAITLMTLFWEVNEKYNSIKFVDDFLVTHQKLNTDNLSLHARGTQNERYKKAEAKRANP